MKIEINKGQKFGRLTVIEEIPAKILPSGQKNRAFLCQCECGNKTEVRLLHLVRARIRSCGCINGEFHGLTGTKLHNTWRSMKNRCKSNYFQRNLYYDKGITVCDEWNKFKYFKMWALNNGFMEDLFIDRIDNSKGYYPENCHFVTNLDNMNNRDNTKFLIYHGNKIAFMTLLRNKNLISHRAAISSRIKRGYSHDEAVDKPIRNGNYHQKKQID